MLKKEKPKLIKFYGFPSPSVPNILYGSTDPKVAESIFYGMKMWNDVVNDEAKDIYGVPDGAKKTKKKKKKKK